MAKTDNILLKGMRGKIGNLVVKQYKYGTVITSVPDMSDIEPSESQRAKRNSFGDAVAYAQGILRDPKKKQAYKQKLKKSASVYNSAIKEYLKNHKGTKAKG